MTDIDLDRPLTLRDALTVLEALRFYGQMNGRPHAHWMAAIAALEGKAATPDPVDVVEYADAELNKAIATAEDALVTVEQWRRKARELRAASDALHAADQRNLT